LAEEVAGLDFARPITHVYNPLDYAGANYRAYVKRFGQPTKEVVFLGMNPGPFGMAQTGIPFGDVAVVRDWLGLCERIGKPTREHFKRPVLGLECPRSEVSGSRLWGAIRQHYAEPELFFERFFVANYCPLSFMDVSGRNVTPDKLPKAERDPLYDRCDEHLRRLVDHLQPRMVIGIGAFAEVRARTALKDRRLSFARILHPSPASPAANRGWAEEAIAELIRLGVCKGTR
jgi:single-strand selective monofunctional uracil DNA glycosylase